MLSVQWTEFSGNGFSCLCECQWSNAFVGACSSLGADNWMQSLLCWGAERCNWEVWAVTGTATRGQAPPEPKLSSSSQPCQVPPRSEAPALCTDGFCLGNEIAPFIPPTWQSKEGKTAFNFSAHGFIFICKDKVNMMSFFSSWMI